MGGPARTARAMAGAQRTRVQGAPIAARGCTVTTIGLAISQVEKAVRTAMQSLETRAIFSAIMSRIARAIGGEHAEITTPATERHDSQMRISRFVCRALWIHCRHAG